MATREEALAELRKRGISVPAQPVSQAQPVQQAAVPQVSREEAIAELQNRGVEVPQTAAQPRTALQEVGTGAANIFGAVEPAITLATGAIAEPVAGLAGLLSLPFVGSQRAAENVEATRQLLTHRPMTEFGRQAQQGLGTALAPIAAGVEAIKGVTADPVAERFGPAAGAFVATLPEAALQAIGVRGLRSARGSKQITGISDDALASLEANGLDVDDLSEAGVAKVQQAVDADVNARVERMRSQGVEPTTGDVSQLSADKAAEARALEVTSAPGREGLAARRIEQSDALASNLDELQRTLGTAEDVGESAKAAAGSLKKELNKTKSDLYKKFAEESPELADIPVDTAALREAMPAESVFDDLATIVDEKAVGNIEDLLVKYGVTDDAAAVEKYLSGTSRGKPNKITPLSVANHDQFRKALGAADNPNLAVLTAPIKNALDGELKFVGDALADSGVPDSALDTIKSARAAVRDVKQTFDPASTAERITKTKRGGVSPMVEVSKVFSDVAKANKPVEQIERLFDVFDRAGGKGAKAIGDFQAKVVADVIDGAFSAKSRTLDGRQLISRAGFDKAINSIGQDKIDVIFRNNRKSLKQIQDIGQTLDDITPSGFEVPKGSGSIILDTLEKVGVNTIAAKLPFARELIVMGKDIAGKGRDAKIIENALSGKPMQKKVAVKRLDSMKAQMPNLYKALAIGELLSNKEQEQ